MYTIGILGFGVVGLAALKFFITYQNIVKKFLKLNEDMPIRFIVWDQKELPIEHRDFFSAHNVTWIVAADCPLSQFVTKIDKALVSPGINLNSLEHGIDKIVCELDIFHQIGMDNVISITGSLGKTTTTKLVYQLLQHARHNEQVVLGGNIGISMLDLLHPAKLPDWTVLELSSFQLERSTLFAPTIALWTNLYPNHLDRHSTLKGYFDAKACLFKQQGEQAVSILGMQLFEEPVYALTKELLKNLKSNVVLAGTKSLDQNFINQVPCASWTAWIVYDGVLGKYRIIDRTIVEYQSVVSLTSLPLCTFPENWAMVFAALDAAGVDGLWLAEGVRSNPERYYPDDQHHRVECIARHMEVDFYNDSKSTVKESTLAAVRLLEARYKRVHVIIGGVSKGVDRSDFVSMLETCKSVASIVAFGKEAHALSAPIAVKTLEEALLQIYKLAQAGDAILFSPGGASFDLFKNYEQRGERFKELVLAQNRTDKKGELFNDTRTRIVS